MYKDRGIIKWAPFDALNGFHETIALYKYNKGKKDKPILQEDQLEILDRKLKEAINDNKEIQVSYYQDGYIKTLFGYVKKVDEIFRLVILDSGFKLEIDEVVNIEVIS